MIASRRMADLAPVVADMARRFVFACEAVGIDVILTSTYRDHESQAALYAQGRTAPGRIITNAKPGQSYHQFRCAFDFAPIVNGKVPWDDVALFRRCGEIGEGVGLEWSGRWKRFAELAHLQFTGGLTLAELQAGGVIA